MISTTLAHDLDIPSGVSRLVKHHLRLKDEPLLMAIAFKPRRAKSDIVLFEVIENFGAGAVDADHELFEVSLGTNSGVELDPGQRLRLVLTNPSEFRQAVRDRWSGIQDLTKAIDRGDFKVLHCPRNQAELRALINA